MYSSFEDDKDFLAFWKSSAQFFAYYVILARKYSQFYNNEELLLEYLRQRGLLICDDETFGNLTFLLHNYYSEIRKRGTIQIVEKYSNIDTDESDSNSSSESNTINGELLRSICLDDCDEFIFNFRKDEKLGWCVGNSSPMYRGLSNMDGANKIWSVLFEATDYLKYPLFGANKISSIVEGEEDASDSNSDAHINTGYAILVSGLNNGETAGIGIDINDPLPPIGMINHYAINVDPNIDYEITFRIKASQANVNFLHAGLFAYDCDGNSINSYNVTNLNISNDFIQNKYLNKSNKYYFFRGIIYSKNRFPDFDNTREYPIKFIVRNSTTDFYISIKQVPTGILISNAIFWRQLTTLEVQSLVSTSWNTGNNLQFNEDTVKIIPFIKISNYVSGFTGNAYIDDIRIQPVSTNYSMGFVQTNKWIDFWIKNNNQNYSYDDLKELFRKYLLPYDTEFEFNKLEIPEENLASYTFDIFKIIKV